MKTTPFLTTICFFLISAHTIFAQNTYGEDWLIYNTSNSGLLNNEIGSIAIDTNGNKWIGTYSGITKFDGSNWISFQPPDEGLLRHYYTNSIAIDYNGTKWIGSNWRGLFEFDGINWINYNQSNSILPSNDVRSVVIDVNGNKWIGTSNGLAKFDGENWIVYNSSNSGLQSNSIQALAFDQEDILWIGNSAGLTKYDGYEWITYNYSEMGLLHQDTSFIVGTDKNGRKWIGTNSQGLVKFDESNWTVYNTSNSALPGYSITALQIEENGTTWIGSWGNMPSGLTKLDGEDWTIYNTTNSEISSNYITSIAIDEDGTKWVGTDAGLAVLNENASSTGVSIEEYNSLKELYDNSYGPGWINRTNWLDTTNYTVAEWYGITVENGHVTKIELPNNNLQEGIFFNRLNWPELKVLNLSGNNLVDANFENLDSLSNLEILKIENNNFTFKQIEPIIFLPQYTQFSGNFTYSPQTECGYPEEINLNPGEIIELAVNNSYLSVNDQFQWYKDDLSLSGETNSFFDKEHAEVTDSGIYYLEITNSNVPGLTIRSAYFTVNVKDMVAGAPRNEYEALITLYNSTDGNNWTNNTNWLDTINHSIGDWNGITVENEHVTRIELNLNNLSGEIPENISVLSELQKLELNVNNLTTIPPEIGNLSKLKVLSLSSSNLSGTIPAEIENLSSLEYLYLSGNNLSGSIPGEFGNLNNLIYVSLTDNKLSGSIPAEIGSLNKLQSFYCSTNNLNGSIPSEIGNCSELQVLHLSYNQLEGPLPNQIGDLNKLVFLNLEHNLIGKYTDEDNPWPARQIPDEIGNINSLERLFLSYNYIQFNDIEAINLWSNHSGFLEFEYSPQYFPDTTKYITVDEDNDITLRLEFYNPAPSDLYQWYKNAEPIPGATDSVLTFNNIKISDEATYRCQITNSVVADMTLNTSVQVVEVNGVHGAGIPLSEYNALVDFYNSTNGENWTNNDNWLDTITGTVDDWWGVTLVDGHVYTLSLDTNNVNGAVPESIGDLTHLHGLGLANNNLSGEIPSSIGSLTDLSFLVLWDNNLSGNIPSSIGNLTNLIYLALNHNSLTGTIPSSFGNLTNLRYLALFNNMLAGPVPVELQNLTQVRRIDLDNNLIGSINSNDNLAVIKSGTIDNNRQIPDELAELLEMDTLHLDGNNLQFNDIEAIFSWETFNDFKDFVYSPQDSIGQTKAIEGFTGQNTTLSIDNYFAGPSDEYQWYKNNQPISGATGATVDFTGLQISDSGQYHCKITNPVANELTLFSRIITLTVSEFQKGAGIPLSEYETLAEIYNNTNGGEWLNNSNWLDTTNYSVAEWYGITVKNGHVTGLEMPGNSLSQIPDLQNLHNLKIIDISSGEFSGHIPNYENIDSLHSFSLAENNFTFDDLMMVTEWKNYDNFNADFSYSPQSEIHISGTDTVNAGDSILLELPDYKANMADHFEWFINDIPLDSSNSATFAKKAWYEDDNTVFHCEITNPNLPQLTLMSEPLAVTVIYNENDSSSLAALQNEYEVLQNLWAEDPLALQNHITIHNGAISKINLSGLNLEGNISLELAGLDSLTWLDLSNNNLGGAIPSFLNNNKSLSELIEEGRLEYLNISGNNFVFTDMEPVANELNAIPEFIYSPQSKIGEPLDTFVYENQSISLELKNYFPSDFDTYKWMKDGEVISGTSDFIYSIDSATLQDSGFYTCEVTNLLFPGLKLYSDTINLKVILAVGINELQTKQPEIYPNPATNRIYVDTKNQKTDIKIFNIAGTVILEKNDLPSGWINVKSYPSGIYIFSFTGEKGIINKKVIIK